MGLLKLGRYDLIFALWDYPNVYSVSIYSLGVYYCFMGNRPVPFRSHIADDSLVFHGTGKKDCCVKSKMSSDLCYLPCWSLSGYPKPHGYRKSKVQTIPSFRVPSGSPSLVNICYFRSTMPSWWRTFCGMFVDPVLQINSNWGKFNKIILTGLGYTNLEATIWSMPEHAIQLMSILIA